MASNTCIKCGKHLTDPVSMERSMGPICWGADIYDKNPDLEDTDKMDFIDIPIYEGIILERREGRVATNVPWLAVRGSPDGFEWGYGGSGPCDLAMNIIENILRSMQYRGDRDKVYKGTVYSLSIRLRVPFNSEFTGKVPSEGETLDYKTVKSWVLKKLIEYEKNRKESGYEH